MGLGSRIDLLLAIDGATGRGKYHLSHTMLDRLLQHIQRPKDIHLGIENWVFHGFTDIHLCSKMHDNIGPFVAKNPFKSPTLNIQFAETRGAIEVSPFPCGQIVHHNDLMPFLNKTIYQMRPDKTGTSRHKYLHACPHRQ
jgi:hypothetical protein